MESTIWMMKKNYDELKMSQLDSNALETISWMEDCLTETKNEVVEFYCDNSEAFKEEVTDLLQSEGISYHAVFMGSDYTPDCEDGYDPDLGHISIALTKDGEPERMLYPKKRYLKEDENIFSSFKSSLPALF